jgi:tRNA pseudouridine13 synthase
MIDNILESMKSRGFINYYGMQRFGTASVSTHSVGLALLKGEWKEACEMLLSRRPGEHPDCDAARRAWWERGDLEEALKLMPRRNTAERAIWEFWARPNQEAGNHYGGLLNVSPSRPGLPSTHYAHFIVATSQIPRNLRLIYVHAYQSYVWNLIVSERIKMNPTSPIVGDLVFAEEKSLEGEGQDGESACRRLYSYSLKLSIEIRTPRSPTIVVPRKPQAQLADIVQ